MDFFTRDESLLADICDVLVKTGCCSRCTLRYAGLKDMYTFRGDTQEMTCLVSKLKSKRASPIETPSPDSATDDQNTVNPVEEDKQTSDKQNTKGNGTSETEDAMNVTENSIPDSVVKTEASTDGGGSCSENPSGNGTADFKHQASGSNTGVPTEQTVQNKDCLEVTSTCVVCLGILEQFTSEVFLSKIMSDVVENGFVYTSYFCALMLPVCVILRENALMLFLKEKFRSVYEDKKYTDIAAIKEVWKWKNGPVLKQILGAPFDTKSPFSITLTFDYKNSDKECNFLLDSGQDTFRQRKMDRRHRKKSNFAVFTRANVTTAIDKISEEDFRKNYTCPPAVPSCPTVCDIKCQNEAVFVAGRYNKYSRLLSQTPWLIEGVRKSASSVEELLCQEINKHFKPQEVRFSSSGREDVDVLMLGNGRPFVLELINPCRRDFTQQELNDMQRALNSATKDIGCRDLQIVTRNEVDVLKTGEIDTVKKYRALCYTSQPVYYLGDEVDVLKTGEIDKVKKYRALCYTIQPVSDEALGSLQDIKDLKILQKTPIRVLHRRPLSTRDKLIHSISVSRLNEHHFSVDLSTQAGTYIKEFVHGDLGRTQPNLTTLLGLDCDILELDVTAVELDWPKQIQDEEDQKG